jgi:hypothetical protein
MEQFKRVLKIASIVIDALNFVVGQIEKTNPLTNQISDDKPKEK